jgi:transposase
MTTTCSRCGANREAEQDPALLLAWVSEREDGVPRWLCPRCAREHVRDIEGKLPAEYW